MSEIRQLGKRDYDAIFNLSQYAFQYVLSDEELEKKKEETARHIIWGAMESEQIAAKLHLIPLQVYIQGKVFNMGGIASVATWPEYRRKGMIKDLLHHALNYMKANGQYISYLHPFSVPFYRKFGWEIAFAEKNYSIPMDTLKKDWKAKGYVKRMGENIPVLQEIFQSFAIQFNGPLRRDEKWWKERIFNKKKVVAVAYSENHEAEGYLLYNVKEKKVEVEEIAYLSINGLRLLMQFIANHDSMAENVEMVVAENDILPLFVNEPRFDQKLQPYFMARIVDVWSFLKHFPFKPGLEDNSLFIQIEDEFLPENSGLYYIEINNGSTSVVYNPSVNSGQFGIRCQIQQLTSMLLGYNRPKELYEIGLIHGNANEVEKLEKLIPSGQTYFPDFF
ncbi:GNAT family N-acetyltransferase [Oceanobacillus piezotolerans]|uniref:GNAT family N-acetyltransferase n=1 Tax=Oceanobacillus piezotolerans TaxID=2448030 RepID=A0A498D129_9BACI|nr:GNAT family N-acetyltransferase [Oceanobacillus piezotolerans]RLL39955.1 GNAT family N-acetyltransferase [Oceanobacillus piezotolerans]